MGKEQDKKLALEASVDQWQKNVTNYKCHTEDEHFISEGKPVLTVLDYWRFLYGNLESDHTSIAEFLVAKALGIEKAQNIQYWTAFDMAYRSKRIEVKSSSYIHPYNKKVSNQRSFSISTTNNYYWFGRLDRNGNKNARQNDIYVFCLNTNKDIENPDPLNIDHWEFYVVPTYIINARCMHLGNTNQKTISLGVVKRLAKPTKWPNLKNAVDDAIVRIDEHIRELDETSDN